MGTMHWERNCSVGICSRAPITSLGQQAYCLNHFLLRCYEKLEVADPRGRKPRTEFPDLASLRAFVEECSRKALDVSLQCQNLNNLHRARLLDILLWAGELFLLLRAPLLVFTDPAPSADFPSPTPLLHRKVQNI